MSVWQDWLAFGLALTFTVGCVAAAWMQSRDDLEAANNEQLYLDDPAERYKAAINKSTSGLALALLYIQSMPQETYTQRAARAYALQDALRVMRMGSWRPTFPFTP